MSLGIGSFAAFLPKTALYTFGVLLPKSVVYPFIGW
jgi:hypothetical protein